MNEGKEFHNAWPVAHTSFLPQQSHEQKHYCVNKQGAAIIQSLIALHGCFTLTKATVYYYLRALSFLCSILIWWRLLCTSPRATARTARTEMHSLYHTRVFVRLHKIHFAYFSYLFPSKKLANNSLNYTDVKIHNDCGCGRNCVCSFADAGGRRTAQGL